MQQNVSYAVRMYAENCMQRECMQEECCQSLRKFRRLILGRVSVASYSDTNISAATLQTAAVPTEDTSLYVALFIHATTTCLMTTVRRTATLDPAVNMSKTFDFLTAVRDGCPLPLWGHRNRRTTLVLLSPAR